MGNILLAFVLNIVLLVMIKYFGFCGLLLFEDNQFRNERNTNLQAIRAPLKQLVSGTPFLRIVRALPRPSPGPGISSN